MEPPHFALRAGAPFLAIDPAQYLAIIVFARAADAERLVAGLPAAARAVREARLAGIARCMIVAGPAWHPTPDISAEITRLADGMEVGFDGPVLETAVILAGHYLPGARTIAAACAGKTRNVPGVRIVPAAGVASAIARIVSDGANAAARLDEADSAIMRATAKPSDGIVSRKVNRPISRAISSRLLHLRWIRPAHATIGTALLAMLMFAALLSRGSDGLVLGALLFQAASIFDGVDGEIARATFRTSPAGARADSLVDAATNLAFVLGIAINLDRQGRDLTASLGYAALAIFAVGLFLIGRAAARGTEPFGFDIVKDRFHRSVVGAKQIRLVQALTFLTSRDFIAFFFALMIAIGYAERALMLFAVAAMCWLFAVIWALTRRVA